MVEQQASIGVHRRARFGQTREGTTEMKQRISIHESLREGWRIYRQQPVLLISGWVLAVLAGYAVQFLVPSYDPTLQSLAITAAAAPFYAGLQVVALRLLRQEQADFFDLFTGFLRWGWVVLAALMVTVLVAIAGVLLVVPGLILLIAFLYVPILVAEGSLSPTSALGASWRVTFGNKVPLFVLAAVFYAIPIVALVAYAVSLLSAVGAGGPAEVSQEVLIATYVYSGLQVLFLGPLSSASFMAAYDQLTRPIETEGSH